MGRIISYPAIFLGILTYKATAIIQKVIQVPFVSMRGVLLLLIFIFSLIGGIIPIVLKQFKPKRMAELLVFTGAFLLGITLLHLTPESISELGGKAGIFIFIGFFLQVFMQKWSHGLEHGHGVAGNEKPEGIAQVGVIGIVIGLSVHAFMEGLPLGFDYSEVSTLPALSFGILLHKLPEAMTLVVLLLHGGVNRHKSLFILFLFAAVSPLSALLTYSLNAEFPLIQNTMVYVLAIVTGAFLHISTTILLESGTKLHQLNRSKIWSILLGFGLSGLTLFLE